MIDLLMSYDHFSNKCCFRFGILMSFKIIYTNVKEIQIVIENNIYHISGYHMNKITIIVLSCIRVMI